ncbi:DUF3306 domain-containing protein [Siccirubricoccus sp. G192]|nr:DUF3306 domain-containing protein [Siccirubricoccus sp. G192]
MSGREEGFLSRWSRRKREAAEGHPPEPAAEAPAAEVPVVDAPAVEAPVTEDAPPEFDPASLPPVESLTAESDIAGFLRAEVPAALRQAALRRIWTLDPAIRDFVGPADYAWDFNAPDGVPGFALELGGDVGRLLAQAIGLREEEAPAPEPPPAADSAEAAAPEPPPAIAEAAADPPPAPPAPDPPALAPPAPVPMARRHGGAIPS